MIHDWNQFHAKWNLLLRTQIIPYMKTADYEHRKQVNYWFSDMKSSLKWSRFDECVKIYEQIKSYTDEATNKTSL